MKIQINTDSHVQHDASVVRHVEQTVDAMLGRFAQDITRIEVHLSDANGQRSGEDDRICKIEARLAGRQPMVVSDASATTASAISGATRKMQHAISNVLGRRAEGAPVPQPQND